MSSSHSKKKGGNKISKNRGLFVVIEGVDGSGKTTQYQKLIEKLEKKGYEIEQIKFPRYDDESSYFVKEYLSGNYGEADEVGPYTGSIFYALDRYGAADEIKEALHDGKIVIADRYVGANMAHQGQKFDNKEDRNGYFLWLEAIEYKMLDIPRPDINIILRVPLEVSLKLIKKRGDQKDIHEKDPNHLQRTLEVYDQMAQLFPNEFKQLDCSRNNKLMSIDQISSLVWETVKPLLPEKPKKSTKNNLRKTAVSQNPFLKQADHGLKLTKRGEKELRNYVTDTKDNVYAFNEELSPVTIAAAMARLSRRGDDMRITILDEFLGDKGKDKDLLKRVITAYGDDSVQQLVGQHVVVEGASQLLTKKLEWGRLASYLEQSTRYIYFDQKDEAGNYRYTIPKRLDEETRAKYNHKMDHIFDLYKKMVHDLTEYVRNSSSVSKNEQDTAWRGATRAQACDAIRSVLPVATKSTVGIFASGQALESLIMHLLSDELEESQTTGVKILNECRKVLSTFLERADKPDRGGAWQVYKSETYHKVKEVANSSLSGSYTDDSSESVRLTKYWPKNEFDILPDVLYEHADTSLNDITNQISEWKYDQKYKLLKTFIGERLNRRQRPGRALEQIHYSWDLMCDYGIFRDLQRHRMVDDLAWQNLTPRYGFEVPDLVEKAGLTEIFEQCFDISLSLYSNLQKAGYELEAQYATLLGHKMRWKVTINARQAYQMLELRTAPQGHPGYRKLCQEMYEKIAEVHPVIAEGMKFINKDEDPELSRLAAEKYTQSKLSKIK